MLSFVTYITHPVHLPGSAGNGVSDKDAISKKFPSNEGGAKKGPDFPRISTLSRLSIRYPRPLVSKHSELDFAPYKVIRGSLGFRIPD